MRGRRERIFITHNLFGMQEEHENIVCQAMLFFYLLQEIKDILEPSARSLNFLQLLAFFGLRFFSMYCGFFISLFATL